mgnify:CR=1 FL=1
MLVLPTRDCDLCPRLCGFHAQNRRQYPAFHNAPVPSFGSLDSSLLIVGLAPGLKGANQTGRPFTGDYAGLILYNALLSNGLAKGNYKEKVDDGLQLLNCRITNAVRCVPPENKPEPAEIKQCNQFLKAEIAAMPNLKIILSLGLISHNAVLRALGQKLSAHKFAHGVIHRLQVSGFGLQEGSNVSADARNLKPEDLLLIDSYHCSRYNINTGTLTPEMFDMVVKQVKRLLQHEIQQTLKIV